MVSELSPNLIYCLEARDLSGIKSLILRPGLGDGAVPKFVEFILVQFDQPEGPLWPVGILLLDSETDRLHVSYRDDLASFVDPGDAEVVQGLLAQWREDAKCELGSTILRDLEDKLSLSMRITNRIPIPSDDPLATLDALSAAFLKPTKSR